KPVSLRRSSTRGLRRSMVREISALRGNAVRNMLGVMPDAPTESRSPSRLPRKSQEINPGFGGNAALMLRAPSILECIDLEPAVVRAVARRPDDRFHPSILSFQAKYCLGLAVRFRN